MPISLLRAINRNTLIAILFLFGSTICEGQDFYDINSVKDIKLEFVESNWSDILDSLKYNGEKKRVIAKLKFNGVTYDSVGVRYKGNSSYYSVRKSGSQKLPFNIKVNYIKKGQKLPGGYTSIKLSNVFRDPSFIREALAYEVARDYMPASACNYARLFVNDAPIGLYNSVESVDKKFLKKHFGEKDGIFIKCDPVDLASAKNKTKGKNCDTGEYASLVNQGKDSICYQPNYELKSDYGWKALMTLTSYLKNDKENIHKVLDVDETLWMLAFNNVMVNLDSYSGKLSHNYYMYQDSLGIFHPILWDLNMAFGGFRYDGIASTPLSNEAMQKMSMFLHYKNDNRPLISSLLANSLYRKMYAHHVKVIISDHFSSGKYKTRAEAMQRQIDFYVKNDENKLYDYESFKANLRSSSLAVKANMIGLYELMDARASKLNSHPLLSKSGPTISTPSNRNEEESVIITSRISGADRVYLFYKSGKLGPTKKVKMNDNGEDGDRSASDGEYSLKLEKSAISQYYIVAESDKVVSISPKNSGKNPHQIR